MAESEFKIRAKKFRREGENFVIIISGWKKSLRDGEFIAFDLVDVDSRRRWTFLIDSSRKVLKHFAVKIPQSSEQHQFLVDARIAVDTPLPEGQGTGRRFRVRKERQEDAVERSTRKSEEGTDQEVDLRPRLRSDVGIEAEDGSMSVLIARDSFLPAKKTISSHTDSGVVQFAIHEGNDSVAASNRLIRKFEFPLFAIGEHKEYQFSLEISDDGTLSTTVIDCQNSTNRKRFSDPASIGVLNSNVAVEESRHLTASVTPEEIIIMVKTVRSVSRSLDFWRVTAERPDVRKQDYFLILPVGVVGELEDRSEHTHRILVPPGALEFEVPYHITVEGCQNVGGDNGQGVQSFQILFKTSIFWKISKPGQTEPEPLQVTLENFSEATVAIPSSPRPASKWKVAVKNTLTSRQMRRDSALQKEFVVAPNSSSYTIPLSFKAGCTYELSLQGFVDDCEEEIVYDNTVQFESGFAAGEVENLHRQALEFTRSGSDRGDHGTCRWLYREKSKSYFDAILSKKGKGIMRVDFNDCSSGDQPSPIKQIRGTLFRASLKSGSNPSEGIVIPNSPFGDTRLLVPAKRLFSKTSNLYFADFTRYYGQTHYVVLVLTCPQSEADIFCSNHLVKLDSSRSPQNPFLFYHDSGDIKVSMKHKLEIRVLYTEDLNITSCELERNIPTFGNPNRGGSGAEKRNQCRKCNLYATPNVHVEYPEF